MAATAGETVPVAPPVRLTPPPPPVNPIWQEVQETLGLQMTRATYTTVIQPLECHQTGDTAFTLIGPHVAIDWLENRLRGTVERVFRQVLGAEVPLSLAFEQSTGKTGRNKG